MGGMAKERLVHWNENILIKGILTKRRCRKDKGEENVTFSECKEVTK